MGEFGFITADDVYHVTVYATDEDGNFKIISMKNIKLFKMPSTTTTAAPRTTSTTPQPFRVITTQAPIDLSTVDTATCAGCAIPEDKPESPTSSQPGQTAGPPGSPSAGVPPPFKIQTSNPNLPSKESDLNKPITNRLDLDGNSIIADDEQSDSKTSPEKPDKLVNLPPSSISSQSPNSPNSQNSLTSSLSSPQSPNSQSNPPQEFYNKGSLEQMLQGLLYRFNYTTDFFGHHEEGDFGGRKDGGYFSIGPDNLKRTVTYKANEFGYQPYVKTELVRPEELQLYDEKNNRLRGYNFEWFYPR